MKDIDVLRANLATLDALDVRLAKALLATSEHSDLTAAQKHWARKLAARCRPKPLPIPLHRIASIMEHASKVKKAPAITVNGLRISITDTIGVLYVCRVSGGGYCGAINNGLLHVVDSTPSDVIIKLQDFNDDVEGAALKYSVDANQCFFCHRPLTDNRSRDVGYGPDCADYFGLSWGK